MDLLGERDAVVVPGRSSCMWWRREPLIRSTAGRPSVGLSHARRSNTTVSFFYRRSRIKEYLKDGRALRMETVVNNPRDLGVLSRLTNLPELITRARDANDRSRLAQCVGQGCVLASPAVGDPRIMALLGALTTGIYAATGITNRSLRVSGLLGAPYTAGQLGYDLGRLRLNGLTERVEGTHVRGYLRDAHLGDCHLRVQDQPQEHGRHQ